MLGCQAVALPSTKEIAHIIFNEHISLMYHVHYLYTEIEKEEPIRMSESIPKNTNQVFPTILLQDAKNNCENFPNFQLWPKLWFSQMAETETRKCATLWQGELT